MIDFGALRVRRWLLRVFGPHVLTDVEERALRFGEEALELIQSLGVTAHQAEALVKQVYAKPEGEPMQKLGGTLVTLASLCTITDMDPDKAYETEFSRCETPEVIEKIKQKHATKAVVSSNARSWFEPQEPVYGEAYTRSVKRSHRAEGRNFVD